MFRCALAALLWLFWLLWLLYHDLAADWWAAPPLGALLDQRPGAYKPRVQPSPRANMTTM
jgi:hypothetical protein